MEGPADDRRPKLFNRCRLHQPIQAAERQDFAFSLPWRPFHRCRPHCLRATCQIPSRRHLTIVVPPDGDSHHSACPWHFPRSLSESTRMNHRFSEGLDLSAGSPNPHYSQGVHALAIDSPKFRIGSVWMIHIGGAVDSSRLPGAQERAITGGNRRYRSLLADTIRNKPHSQLELGRRQAECQPT
jgi:hypothetical protein